MMASNTRQVLLGGGTGFIGSTLRSFLQSKGYQVTVISRTSGAKKITWKEIEEYGIPTDIQAVINVAGTNVLNLFRRRLSDDFKKEIIDSRIGTTKLLAEAIRDAKTKPRVFTTISGVGIYKPSKTQIYTEYSDTGDGFDFFSNLVHEWEKSAQTCEDVRQVIIRSGVVLGRTGGMIQQTYYPFYFGLGGTLGWGKQYFPWIHIHDLCRLFLFTVENDQVEGVLNGVAPQTITNAEFTKVYGRSLGRLAILPVPSFVLRMMLGSERAAMMLEGSQVIPKKVVEKYQFKFLYPTIESACQEFAKLFYKPPSMMYIPS